MSRFIKWLLAFSAVCTVAVLCLALPVAAAPADKSRRAGSLRAEGRQRRRCRQAG